MRWTEISVKLRIDGFMVKRFWIVPIMCHLNIFFKLGQSRPLFVYFRHFLDTFSIIQIEKSIDGVLGIQTWGRRMVGADNTTELWRPPKWVFITLHITKQRFFITNTEGVGKRPICVPCDIICKMEYCIGGSHSSVVSSAPTILRPRVRVPSTPTMLFSICIIEIVSRKWRK